MGKKLVTRNERNQDKESIEKLESEYEERITTSDPIFSIEEKTTADEVPGDPNIKAQLGSIVAGKEIVATSGFMPVEKTDIPVKDDIPTQEIAKDQENLDMASEVYKASKAIESRPDAETKIIEGNKANAAVDEVNEELLEKLNEAAETLLKCLPDEMAKDFRTACFKDFGMKDMGIYLMGLLNRLYKVGDYYNPDIEPEWDKRIVGYSSELYCNYCGKLIENPGNLNQLFCCNLCSKNYRVKYSTGVIKPVEKELPTEEEQDQTAWDKEEF
jgi:hypothetical protein